MSLDGRSLPRQTQEYIRRTAVERVRDGEKPSEVIKSFGLCRTTIYRWLRQEAEGGEDALRSRKATGRPPVLTDRQKQQVVRWVVGKDPRQYGFDFGLWTRQIVAALILERFDIELSVTTVGRLLAELGITPQKPLRRAYERDPEAVRKWQKEEFPTLRRRAKRCGADIYFLDETGVRSDSTLGRTWGAKGRTPVVPTSGQRQSINAISAVSAKGGFWYDVYSGSLNAHRFLEFLKKFMRGRRRRVFIVLDRHPAHIAKVIAEYVQAQKGRLELHFLPGYAPELNPDEFVWQYIKTNGTAKRPLKQNESLRSRVQQDLATLKRSPALLCSFFHAPSVAYILN
jgi:transposase